MRDPRRLLSGGIAITCVGLFCAALFGRAAYSEHARFSAYESGIANTSANIESAWQGRECAVHGPCVPRYYVKYRFSLGGAPHKVFFYVGYHFLSGKFAYQQKDEDSVKLSKSQWLSARQTGRLAIVYSTSNPWANDPYGERAQGDPDKLLGLLSAFFVAFCGVGVLCICVYRKSARKI
jgi:hypothetical protein